MVHSNISPNGSMCACSVAQSFVTPWTVDCEAPLSVGFSRQEYWSGLPFPSPGALPDPGVLHPVLAGGFFTTVSPGLDRSTSGISGFAL